MQQAQVPEKQPPPYEQQPEQVQQLQQEVHVQQPQGQWAQVRAPPVHCKSCGGPITYERDMVTLVCLIICCGICALCCLPKREAVCVQCGLKQDYVLD